MLPDFSKVDKLLKLAADRGRWILLEQEVYDILSALGLGNPPDYRLITDINDAPRLINEIPTGKVVLKIVHPDIAHKSDIGGVAIVDKSEAVETARKMLGDAPGRQYDLLVEKKEIEPENQSRDKFITETIGILANPFTPGTHGFGHELFLGMRETREFGPVINAGLGGLDSELFAREFNTGRAGVTISPGVSDEVEFFNAFKETIAYATISGYARGHKRLAEDEQIADILERFHAFVWRYSPFNPDAMYWLTECEINPFLISDGKITPIDGLLRFKEPVARKPKSPVDKISNLLQPRNICLIGVSGKDVNLGRVILRNLLKWKFDPEKLAIVKDGDDVIDGVKCYPSIAALPGKFDMVVLSVGAKYVPGTVRELVENEKTESIILITGGMGEKEGAKSLEDELREVLIESRDREDRGPVMVGGNSLGVISVPGSYDTMFVPSSKLPKNPDLPLGKKIAMVSQSGAFIISRMSKLGGILPRYAFSTGNQVDLGIADFVEHLIGDPEVKVFGCYAEGLGWFEGVKLAIAARKLAAEGREVIVYKAGRSTEGRKAASGHTAAIAGDWDVAYSILSRSGCIVAHSFAEWQNLIMLSASLGEGNIGQGRLMALSNAGYETVGIADNLRGQHHNLAFAGISDATRMRLGEILKEFHLDGLVDIRNPMDLTPMANDRAHVEILKAVASDPGVDIILHGCVPLSPQMKTREPGGPEGDGINDPSSFAQLLIGAYKSEIKKPLILVIDSGKLYDPMAEMLMDAGIPVFRSADEATRVVGRWINIRDASDFRVVVQRDRDENLLRR